MSENIECNGLQEEYPELRNWTFNLTLRRGRKIPYTMRVIINEVSRSVGISARSFKTHKDVVCLNGPYSPYWNTSKTICLSKEEDYHKVFDALIEEIKSGSVDDMGPTQTLYLKLLHVNDFKQPLGQATPCPFK